MSWQTTALDVLGSKSAWGYTSAGGEFTEPTALCALALTAYRRSSDAEALVEWLASTQRADGSLGVHPDWPTPAWPTSLAVLAWQAADGGRADGAKRYEKAKQRAVQWLLEMRGRTFPRNKDMGHDPTLVGWPWVEGTHAWVEPTALHLLALRSQGLASHARARQAVDVLTDRLFPTGGCNYGNTTVLGQTLRPHLLPTALCLLALAGETQWIDRTQPSLRYLEQNLKADTTTVSLSYGLMALAAHGQQLNGADQWLSARAEFELAKSQRPMHLALLLLADLAQQGPLVAMATALPRA